MYYNYHNRLKQLLETEKLMVVKEDGTHIQLNSYKYVRKGEKQGYYDTQIFFMI